MKMRIATLVLAGSALAVGTIAVQTALAGKDEIKPFVHIPKSWDAAVTEAKQLNLPIVVHSHGWN
jgi:hypothetical protein